MEEMVQLLVFALNSRRQRSDRNSRVDRSSLKEWEQDMQHERTISRTCFSLGMNRCLKVFVSMKNIPNFAIVGSET